MAFRIFLISSLLKRRSKPLSYEEQFLSEPLRFSSSTLSREKNPTLYLLPLEFYFFEYTTVNNYPRTLNSSIRKMNILNFHNLCNHTNRTNFPKIH
nr:MAG TPA: hypothetical protein [Caudoviricetes sp.]